MRVSARAIIIQDGKFLTMFRRTSENGKVKEYYIAPGGGKEGSETLEETVIRELKEEMNVDVRVLEFLGQEEFKDTLSNFFRCEIVSGIPHLGGEELERMTAENYYEPRFVKIEDLSKIENLYGAEFFYKAIK